MGEYFIRTMTRDEVDWAVDMAAGEGWNPGLHDADAFYAQDSGGFLVGMLDNTPVGCISAVSYEGTFGFIGFYIVVPEMRGKGYGIQLWNAAMERLQNHVIGLDGVFAQQDNYRKSGFDFQYSNIRFEYRNELHGVTDATTAGSRPVTNADIAAMAAYEQPMFPAGRDAFLQAWLTMPDAFALAAYNEETVAGYGMIRPCREGYKVGPLLADTVETAEMLFRGLCSRVPAGALVYLDVPEVNQPGMAMAEKYGMNKVFGTARMYAGATPQLDLPRIFGVTTFELG